MALNYRQRLFAQHIFDGHSFVESYKKAYDTSNYSYDSLKVRASQAAKNKDVVLELERLKKDQDKSRKKAYNYEIDNAMEDLEETYQIAKRTNNSSSMVKVIELRTKIFGLLKQEKQEIKIDTVATLDIKEAILLKHFLDNQLNSFDNAKVIETENEILEDKLITDTEIKDNE